MMSASVRVLSWEFWVAETEGANWSQARSGKQGRREKMRIAEGGRRGDDHGMLLTCQAGYETFLARELEDVGGRVTERGAGWVRAERGARSGSKVEGQMSNVGQAMDTGGGTGVRETRATSNIEQPTSNIPQPMNPDGALGGHARPELAFAHLGLVEPVEITGESVNALAVGVADFYFKSLQGERIEAAWPCVWAGPHEIVGLGRRVAAVEAAFGELLRKRFSRVARLAARELPRGAAGINTGGVAGRTRGLFVFFTDFQRVLVAREAWSGGQRRMADDERAPSRSYLKMEEAYGVLGMEPSAGETVCDLGAAPGGWSFSAAKRGARVTAVDNGPLKGGALGHPLIAHRREDAFKFAPAAGEIFDWLFCDLVEEPHHVLRDIVGPWLERRWCRRLVVNLKFGRVDPVALLSEVRGAGSVFSRHGKFFRVRHLFHDREEFTVVGEAR
jgi:23S rRNA (cytidine2498-2'-O)-methyltransferase